MTATQGIGRADVLVHISPASNGELQRAVRALESALAPGSGDAPLSAILTFPSPDGQMSVADGDVLRPSYAWLKILPYAAAHSLSGAGINAASLPGTHTASAYQAAIKAAQAHEARACLMLGPDVESVSAQAMHGLIGPVLAGGADLVMPLYKLGPFEGLLNTAVLYPLTRALFGRRVRYPLGFDLAMSPRMQEQVLASAGGTGRADDSILWPAIEASVAGLNMRQMVLGERRVPHVEGADLSSILGLILGSLFGEADAKAVAWQRVRQSQPVAIDDSAPATDSAAAAALADAPQVTGMIESFQLGANSLQEIWGLVLPPNTLLALKKLARTPASEFRIADALWARIVYDFVLAYRLRNISRSHLLGALTPLYLGWVASYVTEVSRDPAATERRVESLASAFETDKAYLVARWRWPDRFNP